MKPEMEKMQVPAFISLKTRLDQEINFIKVVQHLYSDNVMYWSNLSKGSPSLQQFRLQFVNVFQRMNIWLKKLQSTFAASTVV